MTGEGMLHYKRKRVDALRRILMDLACQGKAHSAAADAAQASYPMGSSAACVLRSKPAERAQRKLAGRFVVQVDFPNFPRLTSLWEDFMH